MEPLRIDRLDHFEPLRRQAARWAVHNAASLLSADPDVPTALSGRAADNWRPLIAIADLAGGDWPARGRRVAETLGGRRTEHEITSTHGAPLCARLRGIRSGAQVKIEALTNLWRE